MSISFKMKLFAGPKVILLALIKVLHCLTQITLLKIEARPLQIPTRNIVRSSYGLLVASFLAHALFIALVILIAPTNNHKIIENKSKQTDYQNKKIISYLYTAPKIKPRAIDFDERLQDKKPSTEHSNSKALPQQQISAHKEEKVINSEAQEKKTIETQPSTDTVQQATTKILLDKNEQETLAPLNTDLLGAKDRYRQLVTKHLQSYNAQFSQQQATRYRQLQTSPIIDTETAIDTLTDIIERPQIDVDCGDGIKKVFVGLSILGNGTVKCRDNGQFQDYIDNRIKGVGLNSHDKRSTNDSKDR